MKRAAAIAVAPVTDRRVRPSHRTRPGVRVASEPYVTS